MKKYHLAPCVSADEVQKHVDQLAARINHDYANKDLVVIGILKGSFVFLADLVRKLSLPIQIDFIRMSSYGGKSETSGKVQITKDIEISICGKDVLVVEDIVDTGLTISYLVEYLNSHQPKSLKVCTLIDKYERRQVQFVVDYVGVRLEKGFVVGYGLDFAEQHRHLPGIYEVQFVEE